MYMLQASKSLLFLFPLQQDLRAGTLSTRCSTQVCSPHPQEMSKINNKIAYLNKITHARLLCPLTVKQQQWHRIRCLSTTTRTWVTKSLHNSWAHFTFAVWSDRHECRNLEYYLCLLAAMEKYS